MSVINYIDPFMGNSSTFAPKENHNRITPWEHMLQKVNSKNGMEKAAYSDGYAERKGICQHRHFTANGIALRTYCRVTPPIFRMVTLFRMVAFIPAHRPEAYALTKKYATMETALLQTFVVHHITTTFPMEQLHGRARLAHKYVHITITRIQTHFPNLSTHTIHSHTHISRMLRHNYTVVLILIEHNCF